ncbi:MAG: hypothetical protein P8M78_12975 [Myxococcota bacterium]|nr:hypothetical protein [Myxococcota bacterium]
MADSIKCGDRITDGLSMKKGEPSCPICNADIPLAGDESPGDDVFCSVCGAPLRIKPSEEDWEVEEDF